MTSITEDRPSSGAGIRIALWLAQLLIGVPFIAFGLMKLTMPIAELAVGMPWAGELPPLAVRAIALVDIAGGLGLILPALTRIKPQLTVLAALGCIALQACAIVFHLSRGEAAAVPLNFAFLGLATFVAWGRSTRAPVAAR